MIEILEAIAEGNQPSPDELKQLATLELNDRQRSTAFEITADNVEIVIEQRSQLFCSLLQHNCNLPQIQGSLELLWKLWLPLATQLTQHYQTLNRPIIQGVLGGQGTGKTTLGKALSEILNFQGYRTLSLSIDDIYKSYIDREALRQVDPRLIWRGPPGTHDVEIGLKVLDDLRQGRTSVAVPRFDKSLHQGSGDRIEPEIVTGINVVLFEGWFVGCRPVNESQFNHPPQPIITESDRQFARDINQKLKDYVPLWERLDRLMVLNPVDYRLSKQWRKQAEQEMIATGKSGMTDAEIEQFVDYFWKSLHPELFISPLVKNPEFADLVVEINADHSVGKIYLPGEN
ncbi:MAG: glycerate kinase [Lyngbya sp.]|nr:glycerate kinase [Lyngbya sp.]